jgi:hypothetical protein
MKKKDKGIYAFLVNRNIFRKSGVTSFHDSNYFARQSKAENRNRAEHPHKKAKAK